MSLQSISFKKMDGFSASLAEFSGQVLLIVNVASKCGLTPQYEALEKIYRKYQNKGFIVLGFPANDFRGQEPGSNEEIEQFCKTTYDVNFPIFQKISVKGKTKHPLYAALIEAQPKAIELDGGSLKAKLEQIGETPDSPHGILWNFEKFLIDRKGNVVARFAPDLPPDSSAVTVKIESLL
tara:strand:+ start:9085 stop:9624 length:540 start_codon:yes stop_codon:yes gene_type:complete